MAMTVSHGQTLFHLCYCIIMCNQNSGKGVAMQDYGLRAGDLRNLKTVKVTDIYIFGQSSSIYIYMGVELLERFHNGHSK